VLSQDSWTQTEEGCGGCEEGPILQVGFFEKLLGNPRETVSHVFFDSGRLGPVGGTDFRRTTGSVDGSLKMAPGGGGLVLSQSLSA